MFTNPVLKEKKYITIYFLIWLFIVLSNFTLIYFFGVKIYTAAVDSVVFNLLLGGLGLAYWYSARFLEVNNNIGRLILMHFGAGIFSSIIWLLLGLGFISLINFQNEYNFNFFYSTIAWRLVIGALFYYLIVSFYYVLIYYNNFQEKITKEHELNDLITQAEIRNLKFQINPHFIFNSLNSISALTSLDPDKAKSMIIKLADFLRYTLANNDYQKNKLSDELKNIRLYLDIEKIRFEDKFVYKEDLSENCCDIPVPNMILQPLFENAIKHAVYETLETVTLVLKCRTENNFLNLSLINNYDPDARSRKGAGVGIQNIKKRLELLYGYKDLLIINKEKNHFTATIMIPIES